MELVRLVREKMMKERLMFAYRGVVTNDNSIPLLMLLEKEMESSEFAYLGRKRLFMFVLENLQNVTRHGENVAYADMSLVAYSKTDDGYTITTGNVISSRLVSELKRKLEHLNSLDIKEIKALHRQVLTDSEFSDKGGAGLGLIEMASKTGNKLDYDFLSIDNDYSYFILSKTVNSDGIGVHQSGMESTFSTSSVTQLENLLDINNINVMWSGHLSVDIVKEVLSFTESNLNDDDVEADLRRRVFSILIEILDNVARYNPGKESEEKFGLPLVMVQAQGNSYTLTTGNLILNSHVGDLKEKLEEINMSDRDGLKELLANSLMRQNIQIESTGNMGLIEMARKSRSKLRYQFEVVNDSYSYYILEINVLD